MPDRSTGPSDLFDRLDAERLRLLRLVPGRDEELRDAVEVLERRGYPASEARAEWHRTEAAHHLAVARMYAAEREMRRPDPIKLAWVQTGPEEHYGLAAVALVRWLCAPHDGAA